MSKQVASVLVLTLALAVAVPASAAQRNRERDTRETRFTDGRPGDSPIVRVVRAVRRGIASLSDGLTVPKP